jgi:excinuclease ABC subunit C
MVGAMIVAGPNGFEKGQYRKFNIRTGALTPGDDYAMMRQVLRRRFEKLAAKVAPVANAPETDNPDQDIPQADEAPTAGGAAHRGKAGVAASGGVDFSRSAEEEDKFGAWPDLVLIDGGEGQLNAGLEALKELGLEGQIRLVGVAKGEDRDAGRERFFIPGRAPFRLEEKSPTLYYLQRLRDEAHRFAIGAHRQKRKADLAKNPLDEIDGVGPSRKQALLYRFGSARGVARAALSELEEVNGVSKELARRIYDFFRTP